MEATLIKINTASAEEISELYGIGQKLADRIVTYRNSQGYFSTPNDLSQVEGVSLQLAQVLAPHIDWSTPVQPEPIKKVELSDVVWGVMPICSTLWVTKQGFENLIAHINDQYWTGAFISLSLLLFLSSLTAFVMSSVLTDITHNYTWRRRLSVVARVSLGSAALWIISAGLGNAYYYQVESSNGWLALLQNNLAISGLLISVGLFYYYGGPLLTIWRPQLAFNSLFTRAYDITIILLAVLLSIGTWLARDIWPLWVMIIIGFGGGVGVFLGVQALRTGKTLLNSQLEYLGEYNTPDKVDTSRWLKWLNIRLPDPQQQKALKEALDQVYPVSKVRTLGMAILVGAGGWLVITAIGGIVEWFVQRWLADLPWFKQ